MQNQPIENAEKKQAAVIVAVVKYLVCVAFMVIFAAFQTSFFASSGLFTATPDLILSVVAAIALTDGEKNGAICGITAGLIAYSLGGAGTVFMPVFYCAEGFILGVLGQTVYRRNVFAWSVYMLPLTLLRTALSCVYLIVKETGVSFGVLFKTMLLPEMIMTFVFSFLSFFAAKAILRPFHQKYGKDDPVQL